MRSTKDKWHKTRKALYSRQDYILYEYDPVKQGVGQISPDVREYTQYSQIPERIRSTLFPRSPLLHVMFHRFRAGQAVLYCIHTDTEVIAYGWIQSWRPFRGRFRSIASDGVILGPYWTNPNYRRQGHYYTLLKHSIAVVDRQSKVLIYHKVENVGSQRVIVKAGFKLMGNFQTIKLLSGLLKWNKMLGPSEEA